MSGASTPLNPYLPDAPVRVPFDDEGVCKALDSWAADQRERQAWKDRNSQVYKHRADLLEAAAVRLRRAAKPDSSPAPESPHEPGPDGARDCRRTGCLGHHPEDDAAPPPGGES